MIKSVVWDIISLYIGKILHKEIFLSVTVKYVTFREPVLGLLSPDLITLILYINRIETNYPAHHLYH